MLIRTGRFLTLNVSRWPYMQDSSLTCGIHFSKLLAILKEFTDILGFFVDSLISLVIIHQDHMDGKIYPLLPWLHLSKTCKHIFGKCQKLIKDVTFLNFLYMMLRLHILVQAAVKLNHFSDPKAQASSYAHTYYAMEDINLATLSIFPPDKDIEITTKEAQKDADGLFTALGVLLTDFMGTKSTSFETTSYHMDSAEVNIGDEEEGNAEIEVEADALRLQNLIDHEELELS